ncbi:unnamed protein product, partial [Staurois parvus]
MPAVEPDNPIPDDPGAHCLARTTRCPQSLPDDSCPQSLPDDSDARQSCQTTLPPDDSVPLYVPGDSVPAASCWGPETLLPCLRAPRPV